MIIGEKGSVQELNLLANFDTDGDGAKDDVDNCRFDKNADQADTDNDGVGNVCDNCPAASNIDQNDANSNGIGDACEGTPTPPYVDVNSSTWITGAALGGLTLLGSIVTLAKGPKFLKKP